jgi:hypothetical protein
MPEIICQHDWRPAVFPVAYVPPEILMAGEGTPQHEVRVAVEKLLLEIAHGEREAAIFPLMYDDNGKQAYDIKLLKFGDGHSFYCTNCAEVSEAVHLP